MVAKKKAVKQNAGVGQFLVEAQNAGYCAGGHCGVGLQAIEGVHRTCVRIDDPRRLTGSVDLDKAFMAAEHGATRWDYGLGYFAKGGKPECVVWFEVHPAQTSEVGRFLQKLAWLKRKISLSPALASMTDAEERRNGTPYHWVATEAGVHIVARMPQARRLFAEGIRLPTRAVLLP
jgi:hypothetical protein